MKYKKTARFKQGKSVWTRTKALVLATVVTFWGIGAESSTKTAETKSTAMPIVSFETGEDEFYAVSCEGRVTQSSATDGKKALEVDIKGNISDTWPGIKIVINDDYWQGYDAIVADIYLATPTAIVLRTRIDSRGANAAFSWPVTLKPGMNKNVKLISLKRISKTANLDKVTGCLIYTSKPRKDIKFFIDNIRWTGKATPRKAPPVNNKNSAAKVVDSFEHAQIRWSSNGAELSRVKKKATSGDYALCIAPTGKAKNISIVLSLKKYKIQSTGTVLADIYLKSRKIAKVAATLSGSGKPVLYTRCMLSPGNNQIALNFDRELSSGDFKDYENLTLTFLKIADSAKLYIDNIRLSDKYVDIYDKFSYIDPRHEPSLTAAQTKQGYRLFADSYMVHIFKNSKKSYSKCGNENLAQNGLKLFATRGEIEPLTFSLRASKQLAKVNISVTDFKSDTGNVLSAKQCKIGVIRYLNKRFKYNSIKYLADLPSYIEALNDSISIDKHETRTFWCTFTAPINAKPGVYHGNINVNVDGQNQLIPLTYTILPFSLPALKGYHLGMYYSPWTYYPGSQLAGIEQDLKDMKNHGMTSVAICFGVDEKSVTLHGNKVKFNFTGGTLYENFMAAYKEIGFATKSILALVDTGRIFTAKHAKVRTKLYEQIYISYYKNLSKEAIKRGWCSSYIQPYDEPTWHSAEEKALNVYHLQLLQQAGIPTEQDGPVDEYFVKVAGPYADMWVCNGEIPDTETRKSLGKNKLILPYNQDSETFRTETSRWVYGLFCWKNRLNGAFNWAYRAGRGDKNLYNDFLYEYGSWVHNYPTQGKRLGGPSVGWEGTREGVDDLRYLLSLENIISTAEKLNKGNDTAVISAKRFLGELRQNLSENSRVRTHRWNYQIDKKNYIMPTGKGTITGVHKFSNDLNFSEYNAIRAICANYIVNIMNILGKLQQPVQARQIKATISSATKNRFKLIGEQNQKIGKSKVQQTNIQIPNIPTPKIDAIFDKSWSKAKQVTMSLAKNSARPIMATEVYVGKDDKYLYLFFVCHEERLDAMQQNVDSNLGPVWEDDCIEIFIDPRLIKKSFTQIIVSSLGCYRKFDLNGKPWKLNSKVATKINRRKEQWTVELALPLKELNLKRIFGINFCRERKVFEGNELSSWSALNSNKFSKPESFGRGILHGAADNINTVNSEPLINTLTISPQWMFTDIDNVVIDLDMNVTTTSPEQITIELLGNGMKLKQTILTKELNNKKLEVYCGDLPGGRYEVKFIAADMETKSIFFERVAKQ